MSQFKGKSIALPVAISGLLLLFAVLAGCCGNTGKSGATSGGRIHLEFWNTMEGGEARIMPDLLRDFMTANPDIEVNEVKVDFYKGREKFIQGVSEGGGPDVMRADRFWLQDFVAKQLVRELDESQIKDELEDMVPIARGVVTFNEKYWAIPISVDCLGLFYNKKHFAEKGVKVPANFDEFAAAAEKLTDQNLGRYGFFIYPNGWYFEPFLFGFGGRQTDPWLINWFTSAFLALVSLIYILSKGQAGLILQDWRINKNLITQVSIYDNLAWLFFTFSILYIPIAIATGISESYIALAALLGLVFNGEKLARHQWLGLIICSIAAVILAIIV